MLNRYPRHPPGLAELLKDPLLKHITTADLAQRFAVHPDTVRRWKRTEAPPSVRLALWAISCAGMDCLAVEGHNTVQLMHQIADQYRAQVDQLKRSPHLVHWHRCTPAANQANTHPMRTSDLA